MNPRRAHPAALLLTAALAANATAQTRSDCRSRDDQLGDAGIRRTDHGANGVLNPLGVVPDALEIQLCAWQPFDPANDPYTGTTVDSEEAHIFRLQITFDGLVNPPGPIGLGGEPFDPFAYGPSPVIGFVDLDADDDKDTGGELGAAAESRYLANVARFGRRPYDSIGERIAESRADLDGDFYTMPQYERTGADFALVLCGCFTPDTFELVGDGDSEFEADETWLVFGRFFERSQGYRDASAAYGGSAPGLYDPIVELRFEHDAILDRTIITLVWALDQMGAAQLAGETQQPIDLDVANQASIVEALQDIIDGADAGGISGPAWDLVRRWRNRDPYDFLDVKDWVITGLFGMPYAEQGESDYAWTDTVGEELWGDMNGDDHADDADKALIRNHVYTNDGGPSDADGVVNGIVQIPDPGWDFSLYDTDGDYLVKYTDFAACGALGDFDGNGRVNTQDFIAFLNAWAAGQTAADFNLDQRIDTIDFIVFLNAWAGG